LLDSYDNYNLLRFFIPVGTKGDCYDRYMIRIEEMRQSLFIIEQVLYCIRYLDMINNFSIRSNKIVPPTRAFMKFSMESLIHHFNCIVKDLQLKKEMYIQLWKHLKVIWYFFSI